MLFPGLAAQMRYSTDVFARPLLDTQLQFFQVEEPSRFQGLHPGRKGKASSGSHCTHNTPRPYETNYTQTKDTHSTQLDTLRHTLRELGRQSALASPQPGFLERVPRYVT